MTGELPEAFKVERSRRETARLEGSEGEGKLGALNLALGLYLMLSLGGPHPGRKQRRGVFLLTPFLLLDGELGRRGLRLQFRSAALEYY